MKARLSLFALAAALCGSSGHAAADSKDFTPIREALAKAYPEVKITEIHASPLPGLYEVMSPDSVVYVDATGRYLLGGPLIDTRSKTDLSREALDTRDSIKFSSLPFDEAIKTVRGDGSRVMAVFADPDCPFCHNLEKELAGLSDVTIYTFLYPLVGLHPGAREKAHAIWCAPDPSSAWHDWMILDRPPAAVPTCTLDPTADLLELGRTLKIESTPVVFLENGHRLGGTRPSAQLDALITAAHHERAGAARNTSIPPTRS